MEKKHITHKIGSYLCHQKKERSIHVKGKKMMLCARCTGIYFGFFVGLLWMLLSGEHRASVIRLIPAAIMILPLVIDGSIQLILKKESNNKKRFFTGLLGGFGSASLVFVLFNPKGTMGSPSNMYVLFALIAMLIAFFVMFYKHKFKFIVSKVTHSHLDWVMLIMVIVLIAVLLYKSFAFAGDSQNYIALLSRWVWI